MDFIFLGAGSTNGYDALGHFLRAELVANACLTYALTPVSGCSAKLFNTNGISSTESGSGESGAGANKASAAGSTSLVMERTLAVIKGATPAQAIAKYPGSISGAQALGGTGGPRAPRTKAPQGSAGRRVELRHDLLHALARKLRRGRNAAQLPARQLR